MPAQPLNMFKDFSGLSQRPDTTMMQFGINAIGEGLDKMYDRGRNRAASEALANGDISGAIRASQDPKFGLAARADDRTSQDWEQKRQEHLGSVFSMADTPEKHALLTRSLDARGIKYDPSLKDYNSARQLGGVYSANNQGYREGEAKIAGMEASARAHDPAYLARVEAEKAAQFQKFANGQPIDPNAIASSRIQSPNQVPLHPMPGAGTMPGAGPGGSADRPMGGAAGQGGQSPQGGFAPQQSQTPAAQVRPAAPNTGEAGAPGVTTGTAPQGPPPPQAGPPPQSGPQPSGRMMVPGMPRGGDPTIAGGGSNIKAQVRPGTMSQDTLNEIMAEKLLGKDASMIINRAPERQGRVTEEQALGKLRAEDAQRQQQVQARMLPLIEEFKATAMKYGPDVLNNAIGPFRGDETFQKWLSLNPRGDALTFGLNKELHHFVELVASQIKATEGGKGGGTDADMQTLKDALGKAIQQKDVNSFFSTVHAAENRFLGLANLQRKPEPEGDPATAHIPPQWRQPSGPRQERRSEAPAASGPAPQGQAAPVQAPSPAPNSPFGELRTATNPKTGERLIEMGDRWVPFDRGMDIINARKSGERLRARNGTDNDLR